jgi:XTP/dITP diphosphohydrolase
LLCGTSGEEKFFEGRCTGTLRREPAGGNGFGYDPLFVPEGGAKTYAELGAKAKNKISHRGRAWLMLAEWLAATRPDRGS